ncbi:MAG: HNH endonuclease [Gemmatimonadetes bacterium]|jgi:hypothetical protein|nr:HNH endonuclease [Gemmatimonadota bacterium]
MIRDGHRVVRAHRYYFEKSVGPIPKGYELDHTCGRRCCVNPSHLEAVTRCEHAQRHKERRSTGPFATEEKRANSEYLRCFDAQLDGTDRMIARRDDPASSLRRIRLEEVYRTAIPLQAA